MSSSGLNACTGVYTLTHMYIHHIHTHTPHKHNVVELMLITAPRSEVIRVRRKK